MARSSSPPVTTLPKNVTIIGGAPSGRLCAYWLAGGARFHVWLDEADQPDGWLYKNPTVEHSQPGYFNTRKLDPDGLSNRAMIARVMGVVQAEDLIAKRRAAIAEGIRREELAQREAAALHRLKEKAPEMASILARFTAAMTRAGPAGKTWLASLGFDTLEAEARVVLAVYPPRDGGDAP